MVCGANRREPPVEKYFQCGERDRKLRRVSPTLVVGDFLEVTLERPPLISLRLLHGLRQHRGQRIEPFDEAQRLAGMQFLVVCDPSEEVGDLAENLP